MSQRKNRFILYALITGCVLGSLAWGAVTTRADVLDPNTIPQFVDPLVIPPVMRPMGMGPHDDDDDNGHHDDRMTSRSGGHGGGHGRMTKYKIAVRQFEQQVLPSQGYMGDPNQPFPMTTVWSYGRFGDPLPGTGAPSSFHSPAFTIEGRSHKRVRVTWVNQLVDDPEAENPSFLPHLLPVDQTLHWANPPGPPDTKGLDPTPYLGPIPIVTHVHGAHVPDISDGYPEAWYLPHASDIPDGYYTQGTHFGTVRPAQPGAAVFEYPNDQRASTLWYHDHALGITRLNVYAGMAGFWLLRDDEEDDLNLPGPAPKLNDPPGTRYYEVPIAIQDRIFNDDGGLFYPDTRAFFDGFPGPYIPDPASDVHPIWNPEFFGNTMMVNGHTWPYMDVEPRLYRFRFLNGCNSRFLILKFDSPLDFHQIGAEGGLLPDAPVVLNELLMAPAERADVIVDFSGFEVGDEIVLLNLGPDAPFAGFPIDPAEVADPATTGRIMKFRVVSLTNEGNAGEIPTVLPPIQPLTTNLPERDLTLNEEVSQLADIPIAALLGTGAGGPLTWSDPVTENPVEGDTEVWRIINLTVDAHPIHLHLVMFQVLDRQAFDAVAYKAAQEAWLSGMASEPPCLDDFLIGIPIGPESWETGWKDTVIAYPGEVTRLVANFDRAGLYVWHCHILEHEDNEMMRPYVVQPRDDDDDDFDDSEDDEHRVTDGGGVVLRTR